MNNMSQTLTDRSRPNPTRTIGPGSDAVTAWTRQAASSLRRHREEMLILAATLGFVLVVALLSLPALL